MNNDLCIYKIFYFLTWDLTLPLVVAGRVDALRFGRASFG